MPVQVQSRLVKFAKPLEEKHKDGENNQLIKIQASEQTITTCQDCLRINRVSRKNRYARTAITRAATGNPTDGLKFKAAGSRSFDSKKVPMERIEENNIKRHTP
jgi:hypothetical protein